MGDDLTLPDGTVIPEPELQYRFSTSGGPGGQHANRSATRVELVFDIAASRALDETAKQRLLEALGPRLSGTKLVVGADDSRSQWRNRQLARRRLSDLLARGLRTRRPRRPTKPSAAAKRRRREQKRRRAMRKQLRRPPEVDD